MVLSGSVWQDYSPARNRGTLLQRFAVWLARVTAVNVGRAGDGLIDVGGGGARTLDPDWGQLSDQFADVLEAWRKNPLARRIVGLVTAYVVGDGIHLASDYGALARFLVAFTGDSMNLLELEQGTWCDELTRSGELFLSLHMNPANGISYVRLVPASVIDKVVTRPGDYRAELAYHELVGVEDPDYARGGRTWLAPIHPEADQVGADGSVTPVMLHFAVNRPVGCVRGESDLASILVWLKRYSHWLEDRVRFNSAMRAFVWIVKVPSQLVGIKREQYRRPPDSGSVVVTERDKEEWTAVTPDLKAQDAQADGRALRWMVAAGGPGVSLVDFGEAETSNLATARAMGGQRARFMRARQTYFGFVLAQTALVAYNRAVRLGKVRGTEKALPDVIVTAPDISPEDNTDLGMAAQSISNAVTALTALGLRGERWKQLVLRLVLKFAGESIADSDLLAVLADSGDEQVKQEVQSKQ